MIFLFRKEIKKWNTIWWFVLVSLALGSVSFFFVKDPNKAEIKIAKAGGRLVYLQQYQHVFAELKASLDDLAMYWGIPVDRLALLMGVKNIGKTSLDRCVQNALLDGIAEDFSINVSPESFQEFLAGSISNAFVDPSGVINMQAYQNYLSKLHMTIADFEANKEREFKRNLVMGIIQQGTYIPGYIIDGALAQKKMKKSFNVLTLSLDSFLSQVKKESISHDDLKKYFTEKRELYRVPEKHKVAYWILSPEEYKKKVEIDEDLIKQFYEKNKSSLYRIPPKVKVRVILLAVDEKASPDVLSSARNKAEALCNKVKAAPETFADVAKQHSGDKQSAPQGGLIDFFGRGTYDPEFEKVAFLSLKKPGDVSDVVRTKRGFEIIKLEDRISATERPLSSVREDIVKTLRSRKALIALRGDLEAVVRTARTDDTIYEKFTSSNKIKTNNTDWLTMNDTKGNELTNVIAQKVFSNQKKTQPGGYFVQQGKHVLYKSIEKEDSYIPKFDTVKDLVEINLYQEKAKKLQKKTVRELRRDILNKKDGMKSRAKEYNFQIVTTPLVSMDDEVSELAEAGNIIQEAFLLTDPSLVLEYKHEDTYYLVQLVKTKEDELEDVQDEKTSVLETEQRVGKQLNSNAFIASLQRNAKIEINEDVLKGMGSY